jgi:putative DNA primase/helicase
MSGNTKRPIEQSKNRVSASQSKSNKEPQIADDFTTLAEGLFWRDTHVCSPIRVRGKVADADGGHLSYLVEITTVHKVLKPVEVPTALLFQPTRVAEMLLEAGITIEAGQTNRKLIVDFIRMRCPAALVTRSAHEGWVDLGTGERGYAMGEKLFTKNEPPTRAILPASVATCFSTSGTWQEWLETSRLCTGNPILISMICGAFSSALLGPLGRDSVFFMLVGKSSTGKSTVLKVCNSLYTDPRRLLTWEGTANGIEAAIVRQSDMPSCLDEIGQSDVDQLAGLAYRLTNASGKLRADSKGGLATVRQSRTTILSTGEESATDRLRLAGKSIKSGHVVRLMAIFPEERYGVFADLHGSKRASEFSDRLNAGIGKSFGLPFPRFVQHLVDTQDDIQTKYEAVKQRIRTRLISEIDAPVSEGTFERVLDRFCIFAYAGFMAIDAGVVEWTKREVIAAIQHSFKLWDAGNRNSQNDPQHAMLDEIRYLLQSNRNKLPPLSAYSDSTQHTKVGFTHQPRSGNEMEILIFPGFLSKYFGKRMSKSELDNVLRSSGYLVTGSRNAPTRQVRIPGKADRQFFYALRASFMDETAGVEGWSESS